MSFLKRARDITSDELRAIDEEGSLAYRAATSLLLFGLLAEWLLPWTKSGEWTAVYYPLPLLAVVGCIMAVGLFRFHWAIAIVVHLFICLLALMRLFKSESQSGFDWFVSFPAMLGEHIDHIVQGGLWAMSGELRTLLLFAGWALLAPALQSFVWMRQISLGVAALTMLYLAVLHIGFNMDVLWGMMRTSAEGLLLGALTALPRLRRLAEAGEERLRLYGGLGGRLHGKWLGGACVMTALIVVGAVGLAQGKNDESAQPRWASSAIEGLEKSIYSLGRAGGGSYPASLPGNDAGVLSRGLTGYGFDDTELGVAIEGDSSVVFWGRSPVAAYWRGEAKLFYDGRGWSNSDATLGLLSVRSSGAEGATAAGASMTGAAAEEAAGMENATPTDGTTRERDARTIEQTVIWHTPTAAMPLFASGMNGRATDIVAADPRRRLGSFLRNEQIDALYAVSGSIKLERYTVQSVLPATEAALLQQVDGRDDREYGQALHADREWGEEMEPYLQVPIGLPPRVAALAAEISGGGLTHSYDQVKAIEQYLKTSYAYSLTDSRIPASGQDFVDHFLFEQGQGYCVHFSTAMVVMLRTQNIPARWVKGFAPGSLLDEGEGQPEHDAARLYEVKGSDAHAWVEVYFPEAGWVPFEPTPGFVAADSVAFGTTVAAGGLSGGTSDASGAVFGAGNPGEADATGEAAAGDLAGQLAAAGQWAAAGLQRGAHAIAAAVRDARAGAVKAPVLAAMLVVAAFLVTLAAVAARQRSRLQLMLALRRYRAACIPRAANDADLSYDRALHSRRSRPRGITAAERQRRELLIVGRLLLHMLQKRIKQRLRQQNVSRALFNGELVLSERHGTRFDRTDCQSVDQSACRSAENTAYQTARRFDDKTAGRENSSCLTIREEIEELGRYMPSEQRELLKQLACWMETARFGPPKGGQPLPADELHLAVKRLLATCRFHRTGKWQRGGARV